MSDLLNQASLVMVPSGYKEDTVYSVVPSDGSGDLAFTRASNGTRVNSAGLVEVTPWNFILQSQSFNVGSWGYTNYTLTPNSTTAPDGTLTADLFTLNNGIVAGAGSAIDQGLSQLGQITLSVYFKNNNSTGKYVIQDGNGRGIEVNVVTLAFTNLSSAVGSVESVGNGWYRIITTITQTSSYYFYSYQDGMTGDGSKGIYLWGAQLNIGSTAKPYFPTTDRLNVPRLTYQNGGGGCPSLLLEKQSTNINAKSNDFVISSGYWYDYNSKTPVANQGTSPDGTNNAWSIPTNSALTTEYGKTIGLSIGDKTAASIWAKGSETAFRLYIENVTNTDILGSVTVNLTTGAITSGSGSVEAYGNGWYRISTIGTSTVTNGYPRSIVSNPNTSCLIYGSQFEASSYPTSYIPTTSSSATRVADACSKTGISSLIGQTEGVIFVDLKINATQASDQYFMQISDGTNSNTIYIGLYDIYGLFRVVYGGSEVVNINPTLTIGNRYKFAIKYANNSVKAFSNGSLIGTDTSASIPACSKLEFNYNGGACYQINDAILFPTSLTDAECQALTTI